MGAGSVRDNTKELSPPPEWHASRQRSLSFFARLYASPRGLQLVVNNITGVILGRAQLQPEHVGLCWPSLTLGFDDRLGLLCSTAQSRWGQGRMTMAGKHKGHAGWKRALSGQRSGWTVEWWVQLWTHEPPSLSSGSVCHVSWCCFCLRIKTSISQSKLEKVKNTDNRCSMTHSPSVQRLKGHSYRCVGQSAIRVRPLKSNMTSPSLHE